MVGVASLSYSYCSNRPIHGDSTYQQYGAKCRSKRDADEYSLPRKKQSISKEIHIHLETPGDLFEKQQIRDNIENGKLKNENKSTAQIVMNLLPTQQLVAPNFKVVVRDEHRNILSQNDTVALPSCLYTGMISGIPTAKVSLSTCGGMKHLVTITILYD